MDINKPIISTQSQSIMSTAAQIKNVQSQNCLDTMSRKANEKVGSSYCHGLGGNQVFAYTKRHQIMSDDNCLDSASARGPVNLVRCHGMQGNQEWLYDTEVRIARNFGEWFPDNTMLILLHIFI